MQKFPHLDQSYFLRWHWKKKLNLSWNFSKKTSWMTMNKKKNYKLCNNYFPIQVFFLLLFNVFKSPRYRIYFFFLHRKHTFFLSFLSIYAVCVHSGSAQTTIQQVQECFSSTFKATHLCWCCLCFMIFLLYLYNEQCQQHDCICWES